MAGYSRHIGPGFTVAAYPKGRLSHEQVPETLDLTWFRTPFQRCKGCGEPLTHPVVFVIERDATRPGLMIDRQRWHAGCAPNAGDKICNMRGYLMTDGPVFHRRNPD